MAYATRNLSVLAYANGFTMWHYASPDSMADLVKDGYWTSDMLRRGDLIQACCPDGFVQLVVRYSGEDSVVVQPLGAITYA